MYFFTYTAAIIAIVFAIFAAVILYKAGKTPLARFLALEMLAGFLWVGSNAGADVAFTEDLLVFWSGLAFIGGSFIVSFFLIFVDTFVDGKSPKKWRFVLYLSPSILFSIFAFSKYSVQETILLYTAPAQIVPGMLYEIYPIFFFSGIIYGLTRLVIHFKRARNRVRSQSLYLILGFSALLFGNIIFNVFLPLIGEFRFFNVGPQFALILFVCSAYAIFKYQLLDIRVVIQRGVIYSVLVIFIVGFYLSFVFLLGELFRSNLEFNSLIGGGITALLGIFTVPVLERYFRRITDKIFFKDTYDYQEALETLSAILNKYLNREDLTREVSKALSEILRVESVAIIPTKEFSTKIKRLREMSKKPFHTMFGGAVITKHNIEECLQKVVINTKDLPECLAISNTFLDRIGAEVIIPISSPNAPIGTISIGAKRSGDPFTSTDMALLRTFALQATVAFEKTRLYEQVRAHSEELEERVNERTAELQQLQENQKRSMLTISHGLQTPLTVIKGELHFVKKELPSKKLEVFERSMDDVSRYITNLLTLARLEATAHSTSGAYELMNMSILAEEISETFEATLPKEQMSFTASIEEGIHIKAIPDDIREIITNLLSNAEKYADEERHNAITISLKKHGKKVMLVVSDTGIGIAKDALPHIFEGFYREKESSIKKGTGLGLAIVQQLVNKYGGTVVAESELGSGSTFTITF